MIKKLLIVFLGLFFISLIFVLPERVIKVSKIECTSQYGVCPPDLEARMQEAVGKDLKQGKKIVSNILNDNFLVSDFSTQLRLPNVLKVNIIVKKATFAVKKEGTDSFALINSDGYVVSLVNSSSLPQINITENPKNVGEKVSDEELTALRIMQGVYNMYQVESGTVRGFGLTVDITPVIRVIFPLEGEVDSDVLLGSLRLIYSQVEDGVDGKFYSEIDLRFKNPVLR